MSIKYTHSAFDIATVDDLLSSQNTYSIINVGFITKIELYAQGTNLDNIYNTYLPDDKSKFKISYDIDKATVQNFLATQDEVYSLPEDQQAPKLASLSSHLEINQLDVGTVLEIPDFAINQNNAIVESNQNVKQTSYTEFYVDQLRALELDSNYRPIVDELDGQLGTVKRLFPNQTTWLWSKALSETTDLEGKIIDLSPFIETITTNVTESGGNFTITLPAILADWGVNKSGGVGWKMAGVDGESQIVAKTAMQNNKRGENYYFYNVIQSNDIVFIRFETLRNEVKERLQNKDFIIPFSALPKANYDMIALVDNVNIVVNPASNDVSITVSGRDLIKLLIEDGTYFYSTEYIEGGAFVQNQSIEQLNISKQRIEGKLHQLSLAAVKSIDFSLKFIINALSNITICNDSVFRGYKGADKIIGYDDLKNDFIVQKGEDTTSKRFNITFPNPQDHSQFKIDEIPCKGIWQIIKLVVDQNVQNYRQVDATLGNETGSILNSINKVCQKTFTEFFTDTYGNQFYFIVRRPPFDYKGYKALVDVAITIKSSDVLDYNLNFNENDVYSWFKLTPQAEIDSMGIGAVWAYLKAIRFEEYASLYGDKSFQITSNYLHYQGVVGNNSIMTINSMAREFIKDFQYLIETMQYMPFVRKGTIKFNGDRRIKRGTVVFFEKTQEYCYVESVTQNYIADPLYRTTTINVSRVMVADYLQKYFQIINLPLEDNLFTNTNVKYEEFIQNAMSKWRVNKDIFYSFVLREQMRQTGLNGLNKLVPIQTKPLQTTGDFNLKGI